VIRRLGGWSTAQLLLLVLTGAVGVGALAVTVPALGNAGMLLASTALLAALAVLAQWLWQSRQSTDWDNTFTESKPPRGADSRISRLAVDIREAAAGNADAARRLHATLSGLAIERLRDRRGVTDPDQARAALGPDLSAYLAGPPTTRLTAGQLAAFTTTLEEL
jgi:hypothetical protein